MICTDDREDFKQRYKETLEELKDEDKQQGKRLDDHEHRITLLEGRFKEGDD